MATYRVQAILELQLSQSGRRPIEARNHEAAIAAVLTDMVNELLAKRANLDRLYQAAGAGEDFDGVVSFRVQDVSET